MASGPDPGGRFRFAKLCIAIFEELTQACRDVLEMEVPPGLVYNKVKASSISKNIRHQEEHRLIRAKTNGYKEFDITLLCTLIRKICKKIPPPTIGMGGNTIGDDIERIRSIRNSIARKVNSDSLSQTEFDDTWSVITDICQRLQTYTKKDYMSGLSNIKKIVPPEDVYEEAAIEKLMEDFKNNQSVKEKISSLEQDLQGLKTKPENKDAIDIPPERFMAYMKNRKTTVRHVRGIVVGCGGAGKTTLLYRLMGKSLNEIKEIESTRGLHVYEHIFSVKNGDLSATENESLRKPLIRIPASELQQKEPNYNDDSANFEMEIETGNSSSLENKKVEMSTEKDLNAKQNTEPGSQKNETDDQQPTENKRRKMHAREGDGIDQQLARDVMKKILDARENEISVSMIDFAGQFAYYACHQIYMRSEAFYVLVLDMSKAFEDFVCCERDECQGSIFSTWTYKDYLDFWLDSIKSFSGPSAQVFAVATHTEGKTVKEKDSFWETLWTLVAKDDKTRLYDRDFALGLIEMNEEATHVLQSFKKSISEVVSQGMDTKIEVPSAWALLEHLLQTTEKPILSISDINKENKKLSEEYRLKSQEEIFDFLSFFHGHGLFLFFKEEGLRTYAILGIQWFSSAFSKLIADKEHINRDCKRKYIEDWNRFNATGNLSNSLVNALWKEESSYIEHKTILMSYMERLRMLVSIECESSWYVPCMNKKPFTHDLLKQILEKSSILCFRFTSFAMFVYYRLIPYCMSFLRWNVQFDKDKSQCLYHTAAIFETENHTVIVGIIYNDIQVQVLRVNDLQLKVSYKIGKSIQIALTELTETFNEKKTFQKGYKCLNLFCSEKDITFIPEDKLSGSQCNCPIGREQHKIDVRWTLGFWEDIDEGLPNQDDKAQGSTNDDDKTLRRGCKRKKEKTVVNINVENITTTSGMVTFGNCDNTSVKQNQGSSAKTKKNIKRPHENYSLQGPTKNIR